MKRSIWEVFDERKGRKKCCNKITISRIGKERKKENLFRSTVCSFKIMQTFYKTKKLYMHSHVLYDLWYNIKKLLSLM